MKFCPNCGAKLEQEVKFCAACGTPIVSAPPSPVQPVNQQDQGYLQPEPVYQQTREAANAFTEAIQGKTNLIQRAINIITKPKEEWLVVSQEQPNTIKLIGGYAFVLALIPAISAFVKYGVIGVSIMGYESQSISGGIQTALIQLLSAIIGVYLLAWVIGSLAPSFNSQKNFGRSLQLAVYSTTPQWIAGILLLFSVTASVLIMLIGLYAIYLLAVGMPVLKGTPQEKVVGYVALTIIAMIGISFLLALILGAVLGLFFVQNMGAGF
jgi:hypothetical protein